MQITYTTDPTSLWGDTWWPSNPLPIISWFSHSPPIFTPIQMAPFPLCPLVRPRPAPHPPQPHEEDVHAPDRGVQASRRDHRPRQLQPRTGLHEEASRAGRRGLRGLHHQQHQVPRLVPRNWLDLQAVLGTLDVAWSCEYNNNTDDNNKHS